MLFGSVESACRSCAEIYPASDLDRYLWCPGCRHAVRRRGAAWARIVGLLSSSGVALYILVTIQPSQRYLAFYALVLALTYVLTSRIASAVVQGYYRARGAVSVGTSAEEEG